MIYMGVTTFNKFLITHSCMRIRKHFGSYVYRNTETKETLFSHIFNPTANQFLFTSQKLCLVVFDSICSMIYLQT